MTELSLYSKIELLIIVWSNDGTKTAGHLTRQIMELLEEKEEKKDFTWICNQCGFENFTSSVPESEIEEEIHSCINCGGFEFHKKY